MRRYLILACLIITSQIINAQFKLIAESSEFPEPEDGFLRIVQMKDGSTAMVNVTYKEGIILRIYDSKHKQIADTDVQPRYGKLKKDDYVSTVFEYEGDIVVIIGENDSDHSTLNRIVIDGKKGSIKSDTKISEIPSLSRRAWKANLISMQLVRNDPQTDHYALVSFSSQDNKTQDIEIKHYGPGHKEINKTSFVPLSDGFTDLEFVDLIVRGEDEVNVIYARHNRDSKDTDGNKLYSARLKKGSSKIDIQKIEFLQNLSRPGGFAKYHPVTKKILLTFIGVENPKKWVFTGGIAIIDPISLNIEKKLSLDVPAVADLSKELFGKKDMFSGGPQDLLLHDDGGFAVVLEDLENITGSSANSSIIRTTTYLKDMAIKIFDKDGKEISANYIPKNHHYYDQDVLYPFYHASRQHSGVRLFAGNQYKSFGYINAKGKNYLMMSDLEKNEELVRKGKKGQLLAPGAADAFYFPLGGKDIIPIRQFVFGEPKKGDHVFAAFPAMQYDRVSNLCVFLILENLRSGKNAKIAWMEPAL